MQLSTWGVASVHGPVTLGKTQTLQVGLQLTVTFSMLVSTTVHWMFSTAEDYTWTCVWYRVDDWE